MGAIPISFKDNHEDMIKTLMGIEKEYNRSKLVQRALEMYYENRVANLDIIENDLKVRLHDIQALRRQNETKVVEIKEKEKEAQQQHEAVEAEEKQKREMEKKSPQWYWNKVQLDDDILAERHKAWGCSKYDVKAEMIKKLSRYDPMANLKMSAKELLDEGIRVLEITFWED